MLNVDTTTATTANTREEQGEEVQKPLWISLVLLLGQLCAGDHLGVLGSNGCTRCTRSSGLTPRRP